MNVKKNLMLIVLVGLAVGVSDVAEARSCRFCFKPAPIGMDVCAKCAAANKARAKTAVKSTESQGQARGIVMPDRPGRIDTFCGYELGSALPKNSHNAKPANTTLGKAIVVAEKLKKPFRLCSKATLSYAVSNSALYEVVLRSEPQRMTEEKAKAELEGMVGVLKQKYEGKQVFSKVTSMLYAGNFAFAPSGQTFTVRAEKVAVEAKARLKGTVEKKDEAYVFEVVLRDTAVRNASLQETEVRKVDTVSGADAL